MNKQTASYWSRFLLYSGGICYLLVLLSSLIYASCSDCFFPLYQRLMPGLNKGDVAELAFLSLANMKILAIVFFIVPGIVLRYLKLR